MDSLLVNGVTYWLPESNQDVIRLANEAAASKQIICLRGAAHSFPIIGTLERGSTTGRSYRYVMLSKMNTVTIKGSTVTVQAGCRLGVDPSDPTGISTEKNSLLYKLDQKGLAFPDLGGITHQTVGGFLSTGSSGGSTMFSFEDAVLSVDIVTFEKGKAAVKTFKRPPKGKDNANDPFYGVAVAGLGLFGVIVSATFQCVPKFFIAGQEATSGEADCEIDLFGAGGKKPNLEQFLMTKRGIKPTPEYTRMMWWPQAGVNKMVVWKAWRENLANAKKWAYPKDSNPSSQPLKPYQEVPWINGTPTLGNMGGCLMYTAIGRWPDWLLDTMGDTPKTRGIVQMVDQVFYPMIFPAVIELFVKEDGPEGPQRFCDVGYTGIPMDNQMSDQLMPVWFTELWIPINQTRKVMNELKKFYSAKPENAGTFGCEIYASKSNKFWLSPSYATDVVRIDIFWFAYNKGDVREFYKKFWDLLAPFKFRPHWGKYLPAADGAQGVKYLAKNYPKWQAWRDLREKLDPQQVFVNGYWRDHLGIESTMTSTPKTLNKKS